MYVKGATQNVAEASTSYPVDLQQGSPVSYVAQSFSASLSPAATAQRQPPVDLRQRPPVSDTEVHMIRSMPCILSSFQASTVAVLHFNHIPYVDVSRQQVDVAQVRPRGGHRLLTHLLSIAHSSYWSSEGPCQFPLQVYCRSKIMYDTFLS